jgi:transposase
MDDIVKLKQDVRDGRIDPDRLVDLLASNQQQLHAALQQLHAAQQRIAELEKQLPNAPTAKLDQPYSLKAEEQRQQQRGRNQRRRKQKNRPGRITTAQKIAQAERTEQVFPGDVPPSACHLSHTRPIWRLENGRAVLVAYDVYRGPQNQYGQIPGALGRSEFGLEIILAIAYQVYVVGLSFDKVCLLLNFFQNLRLRKSQVDALLHQLAQHWEEEFETLCTLLANSAVVHADETSWSLKSVWAFLSEKARVLLFGVNKNADTLKVLLDPATFTGLVISDDAAVYAHFSQAQKCWAHLLRKAIKLTLQDPDHRDYRDFTDQLLAIYQKANRIQGDGRLSEVGRKQKVTDLEDDIYSLCEPWWLAEGAPLEGLAHDFQLLVNEVMRLMLAQQLFSFVTAAPVEQPNGTTHLVSGTNNEAERVLRNPAQARNTGRTNKTFSGARRQTILVSVFESLRLFLAKYTIGSVLTEIQRWSATGQSCFAELMAKLQIKPRSQSTLDLVYSPASG